MAAPTQPRRISSHHHIYVCLRCFMLVYIQCIPHSTLAAVRCGLRSARTFSRDESRQQQEQQHNNTMRLKRVKQIDDVNNVRHKATISYFCLRIILKHNIITVPTNTTHFPRDIFHHYSRQSTNEHCRVHSFTSE